MRFFSQLTLLLLLLIGSHAVPEGTRTLDRFKGQTREDLRFSPTCTSCTVAVTAVSFVLKFDASEPVVLTLATVICKLFAKQSWTVCDGISGQFRDEFFYVFRRLSSTTPSQICGILLPDCADPSDPSQAGWMVELPPKPKRLRVKKRLASDRQLRVLHLSDLHVDFEYKEGSEAKCDLPVCCHDTGAAAVYEKAGYWGSRADCDIPLRTVQNMLQHINKTEKIDYVLMSGDFINHVDWTYSKEEHLSVLANISTIFRNNFPDTPVFWAIGNHEGVPVNSFAPHNVHERFWPTWLYDQIAEMSHPYLESEANDTLHYRGSYSTRIMDGLRLISLNTGFCETTNFFLYLNQSDPDQTMSWLVQELYKSELAGESVQLMAHIPPGDGECLEGWARNYYRVVQRFSLTISAQFFGHVHLDLFVVFYEDMHDVTSRPVSVGYLTPSVTTFTDVNPSYRIYTVDVDEKFKIVDIDNYFADISKYNETSPPEWKLLYSAKKAYNLTDLSPKSWNGLIERMYNDQDTIDMFTSFAYRYDDVQCGLNCQYSLLCSLRMGHHNDSLYCPPIAGDKKAVKLPLNPDYRSASKSYKKNILSKSHLKNNRVPQL